MNWKKTFDIRIRSDNVIGAAPVTSSDTFSYFEYVWRIDYGYYFIVYIYTLGADLGSLNRCYLNLK